MRTTRLVPLLLCLALSACVPQHARPTTKVMRHGGHERPVHLVVPESARPGAPLVLVLHGGGGRGDRMDKAMGYGMSREASKRGWVLAFPDGIENGWNDGRKPVTEKDRRRSKVDDVGFLNAVVDRLAADGLIDPARVMVVGVSNGGHMAYRLAVEDAERFSTIVPIIANHPGVISKRTPSGPVSVMVMNGTEDPLVPYNGGQLTVLDQKRGRVLSTDATIDWWAKNASCHAEPLEKALPDRDPDDGTRIWIRSIQDCADGKEVTLVRVQGGGHTWPGGPQYLPVGLIGPVSKDADATKLVFRFLDRQVDDKR